MFGKKKAKPVNNKKVPFKSCGKVIRTEKLPHGGKLDILCPLNANIPHGH